MAFGHPDHAYAWNLTQSDRLISPRSLAGPVRDPVGSEDPSVPLSAIVIQFVIAFIIVNLLPDHYCRFRTTKVIEC